jgi:amino acid transporter
MCFDHVDLWDAEYPAKRGDPVSSDHTEAPEAQGLRRNLKLWQVIGLSIGLMAPSMAISINPQGAIGAVGRAIPLSFLISMVGALLVAYGFSRLSQHFNNSGSVIGLVGATLGARTGVVAGWCLAGTYALFAVLTAVTAGIYGTYFLNYVGIINSTPDWLMYTIGLIAIIIAGALAMIPAAKATDIILTSEGITIVLIVIAAVIVLIKLAGHSGPGHLHFTMSVFAPAKGTTVSNIFLGVVFGFLSFAGFEAAAALGGEASRPRRDIPRAIVGTVLVIGTFYVVISAIEVMGFGTSAAGLTAFSKAPPLLGALGRTYVANWFGDIVVLGTVISAFGCSMASCVGCSRLIYSFSRDGISPDHALAKLNPRYGTPANAVAVVMGVEIVIAGGLWINGTSAIDLFAYTGEIGTLLILIAYVLVTIGAGSFLFVRPLLAGQPAKARLVEIIFPVVGVALLIYTLYRNVIPYPKGPDKWLPIITVVWAAIAIIAVVVAPGFSRRLGERLVNDEGMQPAEAIPGGDNFVEPART